MFRPFGAQKTVRWQPADGTLGLEHLTVEAIDDRIEARSMVIGERGGVPYGVRYRIVCDVAWRVTEFGVNSSDNRGLLLVSPAPGRWIDATGEALSEFDGCIDIDLAGSPFTNTLPIRRLGLAVAHGTVELDMLFVPFDSFAPIRDGQRYTCLKDKELYRFEAADGSFSAEIGVDEDGLVTDYPPLFRRI